MALKSDYLVHTYDSDIAIRDFSWWERLSSLPNFAYADDFRRFHRLLTESLPIVETPSGIIRCTDFRQHHRVSIHTWIWDPHIYSHIEELRHTVRALPYLLGVYRVDAVIPHSRRALRRFLLSLGFTHEGSLRNYMSEGTIEDGEVYAITREY